ncbi:PiggyBac transposable element-derived protein 3 [Trichinella papuae]|uniref:PiggyBac transposable element-derived protein 3 n=1 Tax=Trichinella papuae TaxID=268474 RepID=A0A0V1M458_9BILA|nr:PiggyBac transposable element-derived protein 3 [Trichinella papuae]
MQMRMKSVLLDLRTPSTSAVTPSSMSVNEDNLEGRHPVNVIVLPPIAGDSGEGVSNTEYVLDEPEEELEPAGELEAEEEVDTEEVPIQHTSKNARVVTLLWKKSDQFDRRLPSPYISPSDQIQRCSSAGSLFASAIRSGCGIDGDPYYMSLYQGKDEQASKEPLGARVVTKMVEFISANSAVQAHHGMLATGRVRQNRVAGATAPMLSDTALIKKTRGSFDYSSDGKVYVAKWHDTSLGTVDSNWQTHNSVHKSKRLIEGQRRDISQADLIRSYNTGMGGANLLDRLSLAYRPSIRGKNAKVSYAPGILMASGDRQEEGRRALTACSITVTTTRNTLRWH